MLGPLLFLIYVNDIAKNVDPNVKVKLFADDCVIYSSVRSSSCQDTLNRSLCKLADWCDDRGMQINFSKTVSMTITLKRKPLLYTYHIGNRNLESITSVKYLGITINSNLKWDTHIDNICNKAFKKLCFLRRKLKKSPSSVKLQAYLSLVRPVLEYASIVWDPYCNKEIDKLERIQRLAARFICSDYKTSSSVSGMLGQLGLDPLHVRRKIARLKFFYSLFHNQTGLANATYITPAPHRSARIFHSKVVQSYFARTNIFQKSFFPLTSEEWNHLPEFVVECTSYVSFEKLLKNVLL